MTRLRTIVLGAGTDIGKTYVSCVLLHEARRQGLSVRAIKPVMSGFASDALASSDAGLLATACGETLTRDNFASYCLAAFEEPVAPNVAARRAGEALEFDSIERFTKDAIDSDAEFVLIEGAGGVLSPLTDMRLNADLASSAGVPVILVTANYLGAVSHTLTAIEACRTRGIEIAAIAISEPPGKGGAAELIEELSRWTREPMVPFPRQPNSKLMDDCQTSSARILDLLRKSPTGASRKGFAPAMRNG